MAEKKNALVEPAQVVNPEKIAVPPAKPGEAKVIDQHERAPDGFKRYRVRIDGLNAHAYPLHYILAAKQQDAEAEYLKRNRIEKLDPANRFVTIELPD